MEFLVEIEVRMDPDFDPQRRRALFDAEAVRARELVAEGTLVRIWRVPGRTANVGIWEAPDAAALHTVLTSLPLFPWLDVNVRPLGIHHADPKAPAA